MAEIVISIAVDVAKNLVNSTIRQGQYMFRANKITKTLLQTKEKLVLEKDRIERRIDQVTKKTEIIENEVKIWMEKVNNVLEEVERLKDEMEANKCCNQGWCPTWRTYGLCKQMAEKTKIMVDFKNNSQFDPFSHLAPLPSIEYDSSKAFTYFESTKLAHNQLLEALRDDSTCMIGLYGMGGSGKTTLVTEVGKKAKEWKLFDSVLLVTVSQTPDIRSIQGKMADMLGLKLEEESEEGRARRLWLKLKEKKQVLIIVDDVWTKFNLKDIGIEFNENNKGSHKVLLTTRRQHVCSLMDCEWKISLGLLSEQEAWQLFRKFAAMDDQSSFNILESVALEVAKECKGLPIAIKAVASSLKGKLNEFQLHEWKVALKKLKDSKQIDVEEGERDVFSCLKLSYDYLRDKAAELLFFMCAMYPEDYQIPVEDLIRYGVGLDICGEFESFDLARSNIRASLNKLLDSCLLEETSGMKASFEDHFDISHVKMHDMVRDLALWMASKEDHTIKVNRAKDVNSLLGEIDAKDCFTISLQSRKFQEIDHQLNAPKLEVLILNTEKFSHPLFASFEGMEGLKVLAIINQSYSSISSLPQSIGSLSNLRTLRLHGWELGDISFIVNLRRLEVLDLQHCNFKEVPDEIEKLGKLKLLDLTDCWFVKNYDYRTIARCSQLEELYVYFYGYMYVWQCCAHYATTSNWRRYKLKQGEMFDFEYIAKEHFTKKTLCLKRIGYSPILGDCRNIIPDMDQVLGDMGDLTGLCLKFCYQIEYLIDTTSEFGSSFQVTFLFDKLIKLELEEMENLKEVCRGAPPAGFFNRLEELQVKSCEQLHPIFPLQCSLYNLRILNIAKPFVDDDGISCKVVVLFSMSVAQSLQHLEVLTVENCPKLRHIIANVGEDTSSTGEETSHALCNFHPMFPSLKKLSVCNCPKLEFIFPISCAGQDGLVQLQEIHLLMQVK